MSDTAGGDPAFDRPAGPPSPGRSAFAAAVAAAAALALIVAVFGVLALAFDILPVADPTVGPIPGLVMSGAAAAVAGLGTYRAARRRARPALAGAVVAVIAWLAYLGVGAFAALAVGPGIAPAGAMLLTQLAGPFSYTAALAAGVSALFALAVVMPAPGGMTWRWERDDAGLMPRE